MVAVFRSLQNERDQLQGQGVTPGTRAQRPLRPLGDPLAYALEQDARAVVPAGPVRDSVLLRNLLAFITHLPWALAPSQVQGITWLELMCLFELLGGVIDVTHVDNPGRPRIQTRALLSLFKSAFKEVVTCALSPGDKLLFKPAHVAHNRLHPLGFTNFAPALVGLPIISIGHAVAIAKALVAQRHIFTKNSTIEWERRALLLPATRFPYRGTPGWRKSPSPLSPNLAELALRPVRIAIAPCVPRDFQLLCTACGGPKQVARLALYHLGKWRVLTCLTCRTRAVSSKWHCTCHLRWHVCVLHASPGFLCKPPPRAPMRAAPARARHPARRVRPRQLPMPPSPQAQVAHRPHESVDPELPPCKRLRRKTACSGEPSVCTDWLALQTALPGSASSSDVVGAGQNDARPSARATLPDTDLTQGSPSSQISVPTLRSTSPPHEALPALAAAPMTNGGPADVHDVHAARRAFLRPGILPDPVNSIEVGRPGPYGILEPQRQAKRPRLTSASEHGSARPSTRGPPLYQLPIAPGTEMPLRQIPLPATLVARFAHLGLRTHGLAVAPPVTFRRITGKQSPAQAGRLGALVAGSHSVPAPRTEPTASGGPEPSAQGESLLAAGLPVPGLTVSAQAAEPDGTTQFSSVDASSIHAGDHPNDPQPSTVRSDHSVRPRATGRTRAFSTARGLPVRKAVKLTVTALDDAHDDTRHVAGTAQATEPDGRAHTSFVGASSSESADASPFPNTRGGHLREMPSSAIRHALVSRSRSSRRHNAQADAPDGQAHAASSVGASSSSTRGGHFAEVPSTDAPT
jgi:hypothetical protein